MDEEQFKQVKRAATKVECPFEKSIQQRRCDCSRASRLNIGEREAVSCTGEGPSRRCRVFLGILREKSGFAMGRKETPVVLPYAKAMQLQLGGLVGLAEALGEGWQEDPAGAVWTIPDISVLLDAAKRRYGSLEAFPYSEIMRVLVHTRPRRRRRP